MTIDEKIVAVKNECNKHGTCSTCPIHEKCRELHSVNGDTSFLDSAPQLYDACLDFFNPAPPRITIRDILDLLDYDRTGIRTVRIVDEEIKNTDTLQTDSYLLQFIEDTPVNALDTVGGVIVMYVRYGGEEDG